MEEEDHQIRRQVRQNTLEELRNKNDEAETSSDACVICLDSISERAIAKPCNHDNFDFLCLTSWLQEQPSCPLCKLQVQSVQYDIGKPGGANVYQVPTSTATSAAPERSIGSSSQNIFRHRPPFPHNRRAQTRRLTPAVTPDAALLRRKQVYQKQLYSLHVGSNRLSRFQNLTPQSFVRDEELIRRARRWIRRELQVFQFLSVDVGGESEEVTRRATNAEFLLEYIIAILKTVEIKGSGGQAEDMLRDFLGRDNAKLFLHELRAWLRSPYNELQDWDRWVQYDDTSDATATRSSASNGEGSYDRRTSRHDDKPEVNARSHRPPRAGGRQRRYIDHYEPYHRRTAR